MDNIEQQQQTIAANQSNHRIGRILQVQIARSNT